MTRFTRLNIFTEPREKGKPKFSLSLEMLPNMPQRKHAGEIYANWTTTSE